MNAEKIKKRILDNVKHVHRETAVPVDGPCWEWQRCRLPKGYGRIRVGGKVPLTHRVAWQVFEGDIPKGLHVLHRCDNPACCNPAHLFLGTNKDNVRDRDEKGRCKPGWVPGSKHGLAKLKESDIPKIFKMRSEGKRLREIAEVFEVGQQQISRVLNRKRWGHVKV